MTQFITDLPDLNVHRIQCIFCKEQLDGSDEHVIPDSLNGKLHSTTLICKKCNQRFGEKLDHVLKKALFIQLHLFGFDNAKSFVVQDDNGNRYKVDHSGNFHPVNVDVQQFNVDGMQGISASGKAEQAAEAFVKKMIRTYGKEETRQAVLDRRIQVIERNIVPNSLTSESPLKVSPTLLLALEKIIVEYYAFCGLDINLIKDRLSYVHDLDLNRVDITICNQDQKLRKPGKEETSHLIVLRSRADTKELYAYIELFNVICGYSVLVKDYIGPAVNFVYHQDVEDGVKFDSEIDLNLDALNSSYEGFDLLANDLISRKRDKEMMKFLEENLRAITDPLEKRRQAGEITDEEYAKLVIEQGAEFAGVITLLYPDDFSDLTEDMLKRSNYFHSRIYKSHQDIFEKYYEFLLGQEIVIDDDKRVWSLERFHFVLAPPREGRERSTVYCHFKTKKGHEKEIKCFQVFRSFGLKFPETASWI